MIFPKMHLPVLALTPVLAVSASTVLQRPAPAGTILGVSTQDVDPFETTLFARNLPFGRILTSELPLRDRDFNLVVTEGLVSSFQIDDTDLDNLAEINSQIFAEFGVTIDHFNWFQVVTSDNNHSNLVDGQGNPVIPPYIDPPAGGYGGDADLWADDIPWYFNESPPPPQETDELPFSDFLSPNGGVLFRDAPRNNPGTRIRFETFLVADFGDLTYDVVTGFSWEVLMRPNGTFEDEDGNGIWTEDEPFDVDDDSPFRVPVAVTDVVFLRPEARWRESYEGLIFGDFGYTRQKIEEDGIVKHPLSTIIINCPADPELVWVPRRKRVKVSGGGSSGGSGGGGSASGGRYKIVDDGYWKEVDSDCEEGHFSAVDDPGFYQQNPRLEDQTVDEWKEFFDVPSYLWSDPVTTYGLEFQALDDTLFTDIFNFPTGMDADDLFTVVVDGEVIGEYRPGEWVDFTELFGEGVSEFQILGIDPLDGADATDIPFQLAFNDQTGDFRVRALSHADVPDPSSVLGILTFGLLGWQWQRQRVK